jgi:hypothetical protein
MFSTLAQFLLPLVVIISVYYRIYTYVKVLLSPSVNSVQIESICLGTFSATSCLHPVLRSTSGLHVFDQVHTVCVNKAKKQSCLKMCDFSAKFISLVLVKIGRDALNTDAHILLPLVADLAKRGI